jgi:hypothetical protein
VAAALLSTAAQADEAMAKAAGDFYAVAHAAQSGLPDAATRAKLAPLVTPRLASLIDRASAAEESFTTANKNSPPLAEGDLYSSLFEGPTAYTVGACSGDAAKASCAVNLTHDDKGASGPTRWTDTLYLANTASGWKVDDIGYGGTWAFSNKGKLSETLEQVAGFVSQ